MNNSKKITRGLKYSIIITLIACCSMLVAAPISTFIESNVLAVVISTPGIMLFVLSIPLTSLLDFLGLITIYPHDGIWALGLVQSGLFFGFIQLSIILVSLSVFEKYPFKPLQVN